MTDRPTKSPRGRLAVVASIEDAERALARKKRGHLRDDPAPTEARNGVRPNRKDEPPNWTPNDLGLPVEDPCPVTALGIESGLYHLIDSAGQFLSYSPSDFSHAGIQSLFAQTPNYPQWAWPRYGKARKMMTPDGEKTVYPIASFEDDAVRQALMRACAREGLFSPQEKLRGRGMWLQRDGDVIYHAGEMLWSFDRQRNVPVAHETGKREGFLYPRFPALPEPWPGPISGEDNPIPALLTSLRGPNWTRPDIDPILLLGWIGVAYLGGALSWRSAVLLLGGFGTGKSTLQNGLNALFGEALFHSSDTSAAGIYQNMKNDARPIAIDELEPDDAPQKKDAVVHLMRQSASGAIGRRGSSGGQATQFQMRSAFLFSAINNPLHAAQDLSRVAVLRLQELTDKQKLPPAINADTCGRMLLTILMREWPRFQRTRELYAGALKDAGHNARGQDTYGTLLAAADMLIGSGLADELKLPCGGVCSIDGDAVDESLLHWWRENLSTAALPEVESAHQNWRNCLMWILTNQVEAWRNGKRSTVGQCLEDLTFYETQSVDEKDNAYSRADAVRDLAGTGLGVEHVSVTIEKARKALLKEWKRDSVSAREAAEHIGLAGVDGFLLAVPHDHPLLKRLFRESAWASGGWSDALRQCPLPGIMLTSKLLNRMSIGGLQMRCTMVVLQRFNQAPER